MSDVDKKNSSSPGLKVSDRDSIVETVTRLLSHLGDADRQIAIQKIIESLSIEPQEKASRLIDVVKNSIPSDREWTVDEIISIVKDNGLNPEKKEIYNVIGYLNRKNLIKRVGYGRYTIYGVEIVTSEDFGGEDTRHEDEYRTARESPK